MKCNLCKSQLQIQNFRYEITGDDSPDTPTEVYVVQEMTCRNPQCPNKDKVVEEARTKIV